MEERTLGNLKVSAMGFGCMGMSHAYGTVSTKEEARALLDKAMDMGCNFFDTAEVYGTADDPHHNEKLLGELLKTHRNHVKIASKCGLRFDETAKTVNKPLIPDGRPETIKASIEGTLKRLQTDHLDLYYIHRIDTNIPIEETAGAMKELMDDGKETMDRANSRNKKIRQTGRKHEGSRHKIVKGRNRNNGSNVKYDSNV